MARRADPTPGHQRLLGLAAVAGLSVATALAFGRVFEGRLPTLELVAVALASVAIAVAFERRGLLLATLASLLGLALAITWIVLPQTTWYGIPSIRTLRALGRSLEFVGQQARERVAPTPPLPPLMLAAVTAVWTASFSSHALAIRAGSPLLAVLPPIALVGFADTVLEDGARPVYAVVLLAAAIAVVFADGLRRVRQWGPVWSSRLGPAENLGPRLATGGPGGDRGGRARAGPAARVPFGPARGPFQQLRQRLARPVRVDPLPAGRRPGDPHPVRGPGRPRRVLAPVHPRPLRRRGVDQHEPGRVRRGPADLDPEHAASAGRDAAAGGREPDPDGDGRGATSQARGRCRWPRRQWRCWTAASAT